MVNVEPLEGSNGEFTPNAGSQVLKIDQGIVTAYENAFQTSGAAISAHELMLESTLLHEYTHYLDDQNDEDKPGEEGQAFEEASYGTDIDSASVARGLLNAEYGAGKWTVSFEGAKTDLPQRVIISEAASGNGTFEGTPALSQNVNCRVAGLWYIQIQHGDGQGGWKNSKMLNVKEGYENYLLRSEDGLDSDFDDLEIRVKKQKN
jgi:hypothetical protein